MDTNEQEPQSVDTEGRTIPPYVAWATILGLLKRMKAEGAPNIVDRSYLGNMSNGYKSQVLASLKALRLIENDGTPTQSLWSLLTSDDDGFGPSLVPLVHTLYEEPITLADVNATQGQLESAFRELYGLTGSTLAKAIKFYIDISKYTGLPLSPHWTPPSRTAKRSGKPRGPARGKGKGKTSQVTEPQVASPNEPEHAQAAKANSQRVALDSGGSVVLSVSVDLFELSERDRAFVFDLIDRMRSYSANTAQEEVTSL